MSWKQNLKVLIRIVAISFAVIWLWVYLSSTTQTTDLSTMLTKEEQFEVDKLKSQWYWFYSEHKTDTYRDRYNVIKLSLWTEQMREVETKLKSFGVCLVRDKYSYNVDWVSCPAERMVVNAD